MTLRRGEGTERELRQFRASSDGGQHVLAMDPKAFGLWFGGGYEETNVTEDGIAIVSISGPLEHHAGWFDSYDAIVQRIDDALDTEEVRAVVMCFDSPGGDASGVEESHRKIKSLRETHGKPIYAYSNESCYSAAYWLACAAQEIWLPPTGGIGSVGVIAAAIDCTEANKKAGMRIELITTGARKADGHPDRPLTDDVIETLQARVDQIGGVFFASVAESRELSPQRVFSFQAACFLGEPGVKAGLADGVAGWDEFMAVVRQSLMGVDAPASDPVRLGGQDPNRGKASRSSLTMKAKTLLALTQAVTKAEAAVEAAKTPEARKAALKVLKKASAAEAKVKYMKRTRTDEVEEDDGDADDEKKSEEDEEEDEDEDEEDDKKAPPKKDGDDDDDDDEDEEDEDEDEEDEEDEDDSKRAEEDESKALKSLRGKSGSEKSVALYRAVASLTGKKNISEQLGALSAFESRIKSTSKLEGRLAKLETERVRDKVDAMLNKASADGRVTPGMRDSLRAQGLKDQKWLKGHLAALPKKAIAPALPGADKDGGPTGVPKFDLANMSNEEKAIFQQSASATGLTLEKTIEQANKLASQMPNGAQRH